MLKTRAQLKAEAKKLVGQHFGSLFLVTFVPSLIYVLSALGLLLLFALFATPILYMASESQDVSIALLLLLALLYYVFLFLMTVGATFVQIGVSYTLLDFVRSKDPSVLTLGNAFQIFKSKHKFALFKIYFSYIVLLTLWMLIPPIGAVKAYSYLQSFFLFKDNVNKNLPATAYITHSRQLMNGHKMDRFVQELSFLGWILLTPFTFGLLYIWLLPYYNLTSALFYDDLVKKSVYHQPGGAAAPGPEFGQEQPAKQPL